MAEALRTTYCVPQMGSKLARLACGTKRSVRAAAPWEIAGAGKPPATEMAPVLANAFRKVLRSIAHALHDLGPSTIASVCRRLVHSATRVLAHGPAQHVPQSRVQG